MNPETLDISLGNGAALALPSGQAVTLIDIIWNSEGPDGPTPRFRFLAPAIARQGGTVGSDAAGDDFQHLCENVALPAMAARGVQAPLILLSMADREVEFGMGDPEATQFIEAFRVEGTTCVREIF